MNTDFASTAMFVYHLDRINEHRFCLILGAWGPSWPKGTSIAIGTYAPLLQELVRNLPEQFRKR